MIRTHQAGTLRGEHAGETVVLAGWVARRRDHGGVVFIDLRDASGTVQVVWRSEDEAAHDLRAEYCVKVSGVVSSDSGTWSTNQAVTLATLMPCVHGSAARHPTSLESFSRQAPLLEARSRRSRAIERARRSCLQPRKSKCSAPRTLD